MKGFKIVLFVFLLINSIAFSQTTTINDSNFERYLERYDINGNYVGFGNSASIGNGIEGDNLVLTSKVVAVKKIEIENFFYKINNFQEIGEFTALETFIDKNRNKYVEIDFSRNTLITAIEITDNDSLEVVDVEKCPLLTSLKIHNVPDLRTLNLSKNIQLSTLEVINSDVTELDITNNTLITYLNLTDNVNLPVLDLTKNINLNNLILKNCNVSQIDITKNVLLKEIDLQNPSNLVNNNLNSIDFSKNILLEKINLSNCHIQYLDVSENTELIELNLSLFSIPVYAGTIRNAKLDLTNNPNLVNLSLNYTHFSSIDLSKSLALKKIEAQLCTNLYYLDLSNNNLLEEVDLDAANLKGLNLKNGNNTNITKLLIRSSSYLPCIEVDDVAYSNANWGNTVWSAGADFLKDANTSYSLDCNTTVIESYFSNFENYLETHNAAGEVVTIGDPTSMGNGIANDKKVFTSRISGVTSLDVSGLFIEQIGGLQDFTSLTILNISNTGISHVDLSKNTELSSLTCSANNLEQLDLSKNTKLTWLTAAGNSKITNIDLSNNPLVSVLDISHNKLTSINLSNNNELLVLNINNNELTNLDLHSNTKLIWLNAQSNQLTSLDISNNKKVNVLRADANQLTYLNLKNQNRNNFSSMKVDQNPSLTCIEVDNVAFWNSATAPDTIDAGASYSNFCASTNTYVPDDNFENYLETHNAAGAVVAIGDGTSMGNGIANDNFVTTSRVSSVTNLDVSGLSITSLTGIKSFTALQTLNASNNLLTEIDVKNNLSLSDLNLSTNQLQSIDLNRNVNLTSIQLQNNSFKSLHFIKNKALTALNVSNNQLITLNVKNENNATITSFNALNNPNLLCVLVDNTAYSELNWTQKDESSSYNSESCDATLTYIPDAEFENYLETYGVGNGIANDHYVETSNLTPVIYLNINDLHIQDLTGIEKFPNLKILLVSGNQLNSIDLSKNTALTHLFAHDNQLTSLDVSKNTILTQLVASDNQLTSLDVSQNPALSVLVLQNNQLTSLDVRNGNNVLLSNFNATTNTNLLCIEVDDVSYSTANWTDIDGASSFSTNCAKSWSGAVDANWQNASNWISGSVPTSNSNVTILNQGNPPIISSVVTINDLNINAGATTTIAVGKSLTVNGNFINNGNLIVNSTATNSGTLIVKGTSTGNVTYKRGGLLANKWSVISAPVANQKVKDFATNVSNDIRKNNDAVKKYAIARYNDENVSGKWEYFNENVADNIVFISGEGYSISRGSNGEVSFTGSLLVVDVVKTVLPNKWNLIGNPFTAFLPMNKNSNSNFINENFTKLNDANKGIYLWDNSQNKYAVSTLIDETQRALAPGQGFFIRPKEGVNNITFKENQRIIQPSSNNEFNKSNSGSPSIELLLIDKIYTVKTAIKFFDNATRGFDPGYDIGNFNSSFDVFTKLVSGDNKEYFTIQSLKTNDFNDLEIPIGVNAKANTELSFALNLINIPNSVTLTLEDRVNNEFFTFNSETSKFTRTISSDLNGFGQFYLHITEAKSLGIATDEKNGVQIYLRNNNILAVKGLSLNKNDLHIYDLHGKRVFNTKLLKQNNSEIQIPQLSKGVYLVKIKNKLGMTDKKIVIK